jgi:drug/metabolite transporter (DMT)-like permease
MIKLLSLAGGLLFIAFGIISGQALLVKFARSLSLSDETIISVIIKALQSPYLYFAVIIYGCAILSYLYISRIVSFTTLNISITGLIIFFTIAADMVLFKTQINIAQACGAILILLGLACTIYNTKLL